jgi:hypothetical protein
VYRKRQSEEVSFTKFERRFCARSHRFTDRMIIGESARGRAAQLWQSARGGFNKFR